MAFSATYSPRPVTDIFTSDTDINRRECRRVVPMKVLILGLGRTGTACRNCLITGPDQDSNIYTSYA
jgi:hypothetical protein